MTVEKQQQMQPSWTTDAEGNIHFTLISNGMTCAQWQKQQEEKKFHPWNRTHDTYDLVPIPDPTSGVVYHVVVLPSSKIPKVVRNQDYICAYAERVGWVRPHWEVACLIRDKFSDDDLEQMGLWWIFTMHRFYHDYDIGRGLLSSCCRNGGPKLNLYCTGDDGEWGEGGGFAFVIPENNL